MSAAPVAAPLADHLSWRTTYVVLAIILAAVTIPAHALTLRAPWPPAPPDAATPDRTPIARSRPFLLIVLAFTCSGFAMRGRLRHDRPDDRARRHAFNSRLALGLGGAGQTPGRTFYATLSRTTSVTTRTAVLFTAGGATTAALALVPGPIPLLILLAVLAGVVRGNLTLLQATAVSDRWGTTNHGRLSGLLPLMLVRVFRR